MDEYGPQRSYYVQIPRRRDGPERSNRPVAECDEIDGSDDDTGVQQDMDVDL